MDHSTITRATGEVRPLLAERDCTVGPDVRLRALADAVGHLGASRSTGIIDGTEIRVRRPAAGRKDRDRFVPGRNKQNAVTSMLVTDGERREGRLSFTEMFDLPVAVDLRTAARALENGSTWIPQTPLAGGERTGSVRTGAREGHGQRVP
ncbi:hypothetical protein [Streptomyces sp. AD55]|uniref:hypothetical protein n=1 Tax=Streptomyces sp. AD55 TaxID=3242895 RepID=UPI003528F1E8